MVRTFRVALIMVALTIGSSGIMAQAQPAKPDALDKRFGAPLTAKVVWKPKTLVPVEGDTAEALFKLLEALEDSDDVQNVFANFDVSDDVMARLSA